MSERLAVSATLSVLMMAAYVLFGADSARSPIGADPLAAPLASSVSEAFAADASALLPAIR